MVLGCSQGLANQKQDCLDTREFRPVDGDAFISEENILIAKRRKLTYVTLAVYMDKEGRVLTRKTVDRFSYEPRIPISKEEIGYFHCSILPGRASAGRAAAPTNSRTRRRRRVRNRSRITRTVPGKWHRRCSRNNGLPNV